MPKKKLEKIIFFAKFEKNRHFATVCAIYSYLFAGPTHKTHPIYPDRHTPVVVVST